MGNLSHIYLDQLAAIAMASRNLKSAIIDLGEFVRLINQQRIERVRAFEAISSSIPNRVDLLLIQSRLKNEVDEAEFAKRWRAIFDLTESDEAKGQILDRLYAAVDQCEETQFATARSGIVLSDDVWGVIEDIEKLLAKEIRFGS